MAIIVGCIPFVLAVIFNIIIFCMSDRLARMSDDIRTFFLSVDAAFSVFGGFILLFAFFSALP